MSARADWQAGKQRPIFFAVDFEDRTCAEDFHRAARGVKFTRDERGGKPIFSVWVMGDGARTDLLDIRARLARRAAGGRVRDRALVLLEPPNWEIVRLPPASRRRRRRGGRR